MSCNLLSGALLLTLLRARDDWETLADSRQGEWRGDLQTN